MKQPPDRRELPRPAIAADNAALLAEIRNIRWEAPADGDMTANLRRIGLEKVFRETLAHNVAIRQANEEQKEAAKTQSGDPRDPSLLNWLIPVDISALKEASRLNAQAVRAHAQAVRQKTLLESARLYTALTRTFLEKYLAYQSIEQGLRHLQAEEKRFQGGETSSFDVTRAQMALVERYGRYLNADTAWRNASTALAGQLDISTEGGLVPEDFAWRNGEPFIPVVRVFSEPLTLERVRKTATLSRPDLREGALRRDALERLVKVSLGADREKRKNELRRLEQEQEKARQATDILAENAFHATRQAEKNVELAQQQVILALSFVEQLRISYKAGFSSARDVLEAETELSRTRTALMAAQVAANLSRIELAYEMGLLSEDILSHPPENLP
jgi:outer membrane protein TolC